MPRVAIIGAGVIGASWAALFHAHGWTVAVHDPALSPGDAHALAPAHRGDGAIRVAAGLADAVDGADFVQESGPERLDVKRELFADLASLTGDATVLATSSSSLLPSAIAENNAAASRILVGHPFNPPELMPLVEVVPGCATAEWATQRALEVYRGLGRRPIALEREIAGFVGNRLQRALNREAAYLVEQGVIGAADLDTLVRTSLGVRWAVVGPFESQHLGGGPAGIAHLVEHIGSQLTFEPGEPTPEGTREVVRQVEQAYGVGETSFAERRTRRDRGTRAVLEALRPTPDEPAATGHSTHEEGERR